MSSSSPAASDFDDTDIELQSDDSTDDVCKPIFRKNDRPMRFYFHRRVTENQIDILSRRITSRGGEIVTHITECDTFLVPPDLHGLAKLHYSSSDLQWKRAISVQPLAWVATSIRRGSCVQAKFDKNGIPQPIRAVRTRIPYTDDDEQRMCRFIARQLPNPNDGGRQAKSLYVKLVSLAYGEEAEEFAWTARHTWESWKEHYKKNRYRMDELIAECVARERLGGEGDEEYEGESEEERPLERVRVRMREHGSRPPRHPAAEEEEEGTPPRPSSNKKSSPRSHKRPLSPSSSAKRPRKHPRAADDFEFGDHDVDMDGLHYTPWVQGEADVEGEMAGPQGTQATLVGTQAPAPTPSMGQVRTSTSVRVVRQLQSAAGLASPHRPTSLQNLASQKKKHAPSHHQQGPAQNPSASRQEPAQAPRIGGDDDNIQEDAGASIRMPASPSPPPTPAAAPAPVRATKPRSARKHAAAPAADAPFRNTRARSRSVSVEPVGKGKGKEKSKGKAKGKGNASEDEGEASKGWGKGKGKRDKSGERETETKRMPPVPEQEEEGEDAGGEDERAVEDALMAISAAQADTEEGLDSDDAQMRDALLRTVHGEPEEREVDGEDDDDSAEEDVRMAEQARLARTRRRHLPGPGDGGSAEGATQRGRGSRTPAHSSPARGARARAQTGSSTGSEPFPTPGTRARDEASRRLEAEKRVPYHPPVGTRAAAAAAASAVVRINR